MSALFSVWIVCLPHEGYNSLMDKSQIALLIFLAAYALFVVLPRRRMWVALAASVVLVLLKVITVPEAVQAVNWNVMGIFVGTLLVADAFMASRVPAYLAEHIVNRAPTTGWAVIFICALTGLISAFVENVAAVLIVAPLALSIAEKLRIRPVKMMIALAVSSNLQGCATLIGDPPSMLLGGFARMNFGDFFFYKGKPSIFFAVELGALASLVVLYFVFSRHRETIRVVPEEKVRSWVPGIILAGLVASLAASSFVDTEFSYLAGVLCVVFGAGSLFWQRAACRCPIAKGIISLDWDTTVFLAGVFVLVGSLTVTGWVEQLAVWLSGLIGAHIFMGYVLIISFAVAVSAFVDNVPFLAAMLPVAISMSAKLNVDPTIFLFGLLIGASLGGNITPIGAAANIVACGLLKKQGYEVSFREFGRIGVPFTAAAVGAAGVFVWLVWG